MAASHSVCAWAAHEGGSGCPTQRRNSTENRVVHDRYKRMFDECCPRGCSPYAAGLGRLKGSSGEGGEKESLSLMQATAEYKEYQAYVY